MIGRAAAAALAGFALATPAFAQQDPAEACASVVIDAAYCETVALGAEQLLPALVLAAEGGNPVPGTASTLGMRLTSMPRWSIGGRIALARATGPDLVERGAGGTTVVPIAFAVDGSVGVLPGWNPLPTVGGVASLDLLWGGSVAPLLQHDDYGGSGGWSWGLGARVGVLRESFTLPGVSVSGMYRQLRDARLGDDELDRTDSYVRSTLGVVSARAVASKSMLLFNLAAGVGWDLMYGDVEFGYDGLTGPVRLTAEDARMERVTVFGELSYTLMVLNFVLSGGVQTGPDAARYPAVEDFDPEGTVFGSAALRLSI